MVVAERRKMACFEPSSQRLRALILLGLILVFLPVIAQAEETTSKAADELRCDADSTVIETDDHVDELASLQCSQLAGDLIVRGFEVRSLAGLDTISEIEGSLRVKGLHNLPSLEGLDNLKRVGSDLHIVGNEKFTDLDALSGLESVGDDLIIAYLPQLESLGGLERLTAVSGDLHLTGNPQLTDLSALSALTEMESLTLAYLPALEKVRGPSAVNISKDIVIEGNPSLHSIGDLAHTESLTGELRLEHNPRLTDAESEIVRDANDKDKDQ